MLENRFDQITDSMPRYYCKLKKCPLVSIENPEKLDRVLKGSNSGIYVLYRKGKAIYTGRSRRLKARLLDHWGSNNGSEKATFAFTLAKERFEATGHSTINQKGKRMTRQELENLEEFKPYFVESKKSLRSMKVRAVSVENPIEQTIFEVYVHLRLGTRYNSFRTT